MAKRSASVRDAAAAAYQAEEAEQRKAQAARERQDAETLRRERQRRIRKYKHLLDESVLVTIFPGVEWKIIDVDVLHDKSGVLRVRDASDLDSPVFHISATETWIEYRRVDNSYGRYTEQDDKWPVRTALDVGRYLKYQRDAIDEFYRRNPD